MEELYLNNNGSYAKSVNAQIYDFLNEEDLKIRYSYILAGHKIFLEIIFVLCIILNIFALIQLAKKHKQWSGSSILLINLAIADILVALLVILPEIIWSITISWKFGNFLCKLSQMLKHFSLYLESFMVVGIGYNRFYMFSKEFSFKKDKVLTIQTLVIAYTSSFLLSIPQFYVYRLVKSSFIRNYTQCAEIDTFDEPWQSQGYYIFNLLLIYDMPFAITVYLYTKIIFYIKIDYPYLVSIKHSGSSEEELSAKTNLVEKRRHKSLRTSLMITLFFTVCWTPYAILEFFHIFSKQELRDEQITFQKLMLDLAFLHPTFNPLVHGGYQFFRQ